MVVIESERAYHQEENGGDDAERCMYEEQNIEMPAPPSPTYAASSFSLASSTHHLARKTTSVLGATSTVVAAERSDTCESSALKQPPSPSMSCMGLILNRLLVAEKAHDTIELLIDMQFFKPEHASIRDEFARANGCRYVAQAMQDYLDNVEVQCKCCMLLTNLACSLEKKPETMFTQDTAQAIVNAMQCFPQHRDVQSYGCGALRNLLAAQLKHMVIQAGGIPAVIGAMHEHPDDRYVQENAAACLGSLAHTEALKEEIVEQGGAILLAQAQHRFWSSDYYPVQINARRALERLYSGNGAGRSV